MNSVIESMGGLFINIGLLHLISVPDPPTPVRNYRFFLTLKIGKIVFTPEDFHKMWAYPWRIWVYPWRISWKLKLHPQRIQYLFYYTPKEILNFYNLPLKNSMVPQPRGADIKRNSPLWVFCRNLTTTSSDEEI